MRPSGVAWGLNATPGPVNMRSSLSGRQDHAMSPHPRMLPASRAKGRLQMRCPRVPESQSPRPQTLTHTPKPKHPRTPAHRSSAYSGRTTESIGSPGRQATPQPTTSFPTLEVSVRALTVSRRTASNCPSVLNVGSEHCYAVAARNAPRRDENATVTRSIVDDPEAWRRGDTAGHDEYRYNKTKRTVERSACLSIRQSGFCSACPSVSQSLQPKPTVLPALQVPGPGSALTPKKTRQRNVHIARCGPGPGANR